MPAASISARATKTGRKFGIGLPRVSYAVFPRRFDVHPTCRKSQANMLPIQTSVGVASGCSFIVMSSEQDAADGAFYEGASGGVLSAGASFCDECFGPKLAAQIAIGLEPSVSERAHGSISGVMPNLARFSASSCSTA